jgi:ornithine cyclodeaminase/alanine dehydrogenase
MGAPALRYLSATDVDACLPGVEERLELARRALVALGRGEAEMPPKIGVHPRDGSLIHAMPAFLRNEDLVGLKWIAAFPGNRAHRLPAINGIVVLNDPQTGVPTWIMDAARITAVRTAAVSGVAIRLFGPPDVQRVAILGAGVQAASHAEMLSGLLPDAELVIYDRHTERAQATADQATAAGQHAVTATDAREAAAAAQVVITVASLTGGSQQMKPDWLADGALAVAVDFATYASAELAREVGRFVVDDRDQFLAYREAGYFDGYPKPDRTMGEELAADASRGRGDMLRDSRLPALVTHLGVGLADVLFADAIRRRAERLSVGVELTR